MYLRALRRVLRRKSENILFSLTLVDSSLLFFRKKSGKEKKADISFLVFISQGRTSSPFLLVLSILSLPRRSTQMDPRTITKEKGKKSFPNARFSLFDIPSSRGEEKQAKRK